jgi:hypothetical protein
MGVANPLYPLRSKFGEGYTSHPKLELCVKLRVCDPLWASESEIHKTLQFDLFPRTVHVMDIYLVPTLSQRGESGRGTPQLLSFDPGLSANMSLAGQ